MTQSSDALLSHWMTSNNTALLCENENGNTHETSILELPQKVLKFTTHALGAKAKGKSVMLFTQALELRTVQAAGLLNLSRP